MFSNAIAREIVKAAEAHSIEPATLLAIVEVETGGKAFEQDGRTPALLFERHVAYREAKKRSTALLSAFQRAGLAIPRWNKAVQYKDERTSAQRLALIARAQQLDAEIACRSASWGIGQTMGFNAEALGFNNAREMVQHMTGDFAGQVDCMIRELKHSDLIKSLNAHDWVRVARIYNGAGYAANQYDVKLRDAWKRWSRKLPIGGTQPEETLAKDEIKLIQQDLRDLGYHEVGHVDGLWGSRTAGALSAFQHHEGLSVTGHYDETTREALLAAMPRPVSRERSSTTIGDLRARGSNTIRQADNLTAAASAKIAAGLTVVASAAPDWNVVVCGVALIAAGIVVLWITSKVKANRLADHRTGKHS